MNDRLSREVARALRHAPDEYGLVLDHEGWTSVAALFEAIGKRDAPFCQHTAADIEKIIVDEERFEVSAGRVRARYGHSNVEVDYGEPQIPPAQLFHATSTRALADIAHEGLTPRTRNYLHLTSSWLYAIRVKEQRELDSKGSTMLIVAARDALTKTAVPFFKASETIWVTAYVGPEHLSLAIVTREGLLDGSRPLTDPRADSKGSRLSSLAPDS
jgi:putative RNA 2'-phosphotransferase